MEPEVVGQRIVHQARTLCAAAAAALSRMEPGSRHLGLDACAGAAAETVGVLALASTGSGLADLAASDGCPVTTHDLLHDPRIRFPPSARASIAATDHRAVLCVPLRVDAAIVGVLAVGD